MRFTDFFVCAGCGGRMQAVETDEGTDLVIQHEGACPEKEESNG